MNDEALRYENIIRAAQNVERLYIMAARADAYRGLETSYVNYRDNADQDRLQELLFQYAFDCGEIATNLSVALYEFERRNSANLTDEDRETMDRIDDLLSNARMSDISKSLKVIEELLRRHNLIA